MAASASAVAPKIPRRNMLKRGRAMPDATISSIVFTSEMESFLSTDQISRRMDGISVAGSTAVRTHMTSAPQVFCGYGTYNRVPDVVGELVVAHVRHDSDNLAVQVFIAPGAYAPSERVLAGEHLARHVLAQDDNG